MPHIPEGYGQINFVWSVTNDPEPMLNTIGFGIDGTTGIDAGAFANEAMDAWGDLWATELSTPLWLERVDLLLGPSGSLIITSSTDARRQMGTSGSMTPPNCALLVKKRTIVGGRENRGRMYIPGVNEPTVDNVGNLDSGFIASVNTKLETFRTRINAYAGVTQLVILHTDETAEPTPISALVVDPRLATMRQRLRR